MLLYNISAEAQRETLSLEPCSPPLIPAKGTQAMSLIHLGGSIKPGSPEGSHLGRSPWGGGYTSEAWGWGGEIPQQTLPRIRVRLPPGHA